jgi:serine/threonine-protein kinase
MALLGATLWMVALVADHLALRAMTGGDPRWLALDVDDVVAAAVISLSLALYAFTRSKGREPRLMLWLGHGYMIVTAMAIGLLFHWSEVPADYAIQPMISWIGAVVLMFAAIIPSTPTMMFFAGLVSVSMNPLGMLLSRARGDWDFGATSKIFLMHYPDYLLLGVAVVISGVVMRLRQQVVRAREMGSYQLDELLGRGGMGEVYRATHRMLARPAAIKLIRPAAITDAGGSGADLAVKRFRREAEAAANLRSPHTVELYDFGVTEDGTFYFVMELLQGMDLEMMVRQHGPQPAARVIAILMQVCESLEEAHLQGLVHRDIKPANIHIGKLGLRYDFVKVLDFGLVKAITDEQNMGQSLETAAGLTPGTPSYMAPEMAMGEKVDGRADIYALGCVAYYLLTGRLVFEAENALQMVGKHLGQAPVPPSTRVPGLELPPGLEAVVLRCLAKPPGGRPGSASELRELLATITTTPWTERMAREWWSTRVST